MNNQLKTVLDIAPIAIFFVAYKFLGLIWATGLLVAATLISLTLTYYKIKKISYVLLLTAAVVAIFGSLTIFLNDEFFIKIKPTVVNLIFAAILLGGLVKNKILLKHVLGSALAMDEKGWRILTLRYGLFFILLAGLNEFIWRNFSTDLWVDFKVFGIIGLTTLFTVLQAPVIKKYQV